MFSFEPKTLHTKRLILRKALLSDAPAMFNNWAKDSEVTKYLSWYPHRDVGASSLMLELWRGLSSKEKMTMWVCEDKKLKEVIGSVSLLLSDEKKRLGEIGFCFGKNFWGQGIATEVLAKIIEYAFSIGYEMLICRTRQENIAAKKVITKNNMEYLETKEVFWLKDQKNYFLDTYIIKKLI